MSPDRSETRYPNLKQAMEDGRVDGSHKPTPEARQPRNTICPKCDGSGDDPDAADEGFDRACSLCGGLGWMPPHPAYPEVPE